MYVHVYACVYVYVYVRIIRVCMYVCTRACVCATHARQRGGYPCTARPSDQQAWIPELSVACTYIQTYISVGFEVSRWAVYLVENHGTAAYRELRPFGKQKTPSMIHLM
jgi:hypothetical protein